MAYYQLVKSETFSKNWVITLNSLKIQQKNYFSPQNSNLYAYAANNPVRYIDPDGNESRVSQLFTEDDYWQTEEFQNRLDEFISSPEFRASPFKVVAFINGEFTTNPKKIWGHALKNIGKIVFVGGMELVNDFGSVASVAAYSSGNVVLGVTIDGLSLACDIGLDLYDYSISGDKKQLVDNLLNTVVANAIGKMAAKGISGKYTEKALKEKIQPIIEEIVSQGYITLNEIMKKITEGQNE